EQLAAAGTDPRRTHFLLANYADELLNAGHPEEALQQYARLEQVLGEEDPEGLARHPRWLRLHQAVAYLRLGEQQNCLQHHGAESCLLPIQGSGIHQLRAGSEGAARVLTGMLREN